MAKNHDEPAKDVQITPPSGTLKIDVSDAITVVASGTALHLVPGQPDKVESAYLPNIGEIGPESLNEGFGKLWQMVNGLAQFGSPDQPGFYADEIELRFEMMAGGGLRILGSGLEMNTTGGIRVVFRRGKQG